MSRIELPDLSSFSAVLTATMALALALTYASAGRTIARSPRASRALRDLRAKTLRLKAELDLIEKAKAEVFEALDDAEPTDLERLELIGERMKTFREAVRSGQKAARALDRSLIEALTFDPIFQATIPEWRAKSRELRDLLVKLSDQTLTRGVDDIEAQLAVIVQRATADAGLSDWARSMDDDDESLLNVAEGTPVAWDPNRGWH